MAAFTRSHVRRSHHYRACVAIDWHGVGVAIGEWNWQAIGTIVALGALLVALWFSLRSLRLTREGQQLTRGGQQQDRQIAEATAERSEAAARLTEEYTRRVVDALEALAAGATAERAPRVA
jgi:hypothetical protein